MCCYTHKHDSTEQFPSSSTPSPVSTPLTSSPLFILTEIVGMPSLPSCVCLSPFSLCIFLQVSRRDVHAVWISASDKLCPLSAPSYTVPPFFPSSSFWSCSRLFPVIREFFLSTVRTCLSGGSLLWIFCLCKAPRDNLLCKRCDITQTGLK